MNILAKLNDGLLYCDGGFGSLLQARGLKPGQIPDLWNLDNPDAVKEAHLEYLRAGADIINTNTFGSNRDRLGHRFEETVAAGVKLAGEAVRENGGGFVALDIGPTGRMFEPFGELTFPHALELFAETVRLGAAAGADLINIETMGDLMEAKAAVIAAKENCDLPVFVSVAFSDKGKLLMGSDALTAATLLEALGADAVGLNCGVSPHKALELAEELASCLSIPLIVCPNAGMPHIRDGRTVYDVTPDDFADAMALVVRAGARVIGGCCGTTPAHIKALRERTASEKPVPLKEKKRVVVSSSMQAFELGSVPALIGNAIDPETEPTVAAAFLSGDTGAAVDEAVAQAAEEAHLIAVCARKDGVNERELLSEAVADVQTVARTPLLLRTTDLFAAERALRAYNGRPIWYYETDADLEKAFALAKKYGAVLALPTLDRGAPPETAQGRLKAAETLLKAAEKRGLRPVDLMFDTCIAADNAETALDAAKMIHKDLGCRTLLDIPGCFRGDPDADKKAAEATKRAFLAGVDAVFADVSSDALAAVT